MQNPTPRLLRDDERVREQFLRRLFLSVHDEPDFATWENTLSQMESIDFSQILSEHMLQFYTFLNNPTRENFAAWREVISDSFEDCGVADDWNISPMFMNVIFTRTYRDLEIDDETVPVEPYESLEQASETNMYARDLATFVLAIAECDKKMPSMAHVAEKLLSEAEARESIDDADNDEDHGEEEDDEESSDDADDNHAE